MSEGNAGPYERAIRAAMAEQSTDAALRKHRLAKRTFTQGRYMVLIADEEALAPEVRGRAREALAVLEKDGHTANAWPLIEGIVNQRYGPPSRRKTGRAQSVSDLAEARMEEFRRALDAVINVCDASPKIHVPLLPGETARDGAKALGRAITNLRDLKRRVEEAAQ